MRTKDQYGPEHCVCVASVIANFKQEVKEGDLRLHPLVTRPVDMETLEKMEAKKVAPPRQRQDGFGEFL